MPAQCLLGSVQVYQHALALRTVDVQLSRPLSLLPSTSPVFFVPCSLIVCTGTRRDVEAFLLLHTRPLWSLCVLADLVSGIWLPCARLLGMSNWYVLFLLSSPIQSHSHIRALQRWWKERR